MSAILLDELVERMGKDLVDPEPYIEPLPEKVPSRLALMARASKDLENERLDYDTLLNDANPNPSLRDQEYLQHSSLWGHHYVTGGTGEIGAHHFKLQPKTDATLPAYCNPPNPCPVGYTEDQGCELNFENSAAFSRDYQAAQECMCDGEHMFDCPGPKDGATDGRQMNSDLESFLARQFHTGGGNSGGAGDKNFVAKKYQPSHRVSDLVFMTITVHKNDISFINFYTELKPVSKWRKITHRR